MKLTQDDKALLLRWGYIERDFAQTEEATRRTTYKFCGEQIRRDETICLLGREKYLSGISRSAFHYSAARGTDDGQVIYFDSSRLFKNGKA